jgi:hypothetical protein
MMHVTLISLLQGSAPIQSSTDTVLDWFTGALVFVGFLQVWALVGQMRLVKSQDDHFKNSERAWLLADLSWWREGLNVALLSERTGFDPEARFTVVTAKLTCRNEGKSPAWIDEVRTKGEIVKRPNNVAPDKESLQCNGPMQPAGADKESFKVLQIKCRGHATKEDFVCLYVLVEYHDIFGIPRETKLGYALDAGQLARQDALTERNGNT